MGYFVSSSSVSISRCSSKFSKMTPVPRATAVSGSSATTTGTLSHSWRSASRPPSSAPPPTSTIPPRMMSDKISGGVVSSTSRTDSTSVSIDCDIASRMSESVSIASRGRPVIRSRPRMGASSCHAPSDTEPMAILTASAVFSPIKILNSERTYAMMSWFNFSPAMRRFFERTMPPRPSTAMSVLPPPMSTIIEPTASRMGRRTPSAAAMGSSIMCTSRAPAFCAASLTARISTLVMPLGTPMTTRGPSIFFCSTCARFIRYASISSVASKSETTPSTNGFTATRCAGVRPSMSRAAVPTATTWPVFWLTATTDGSVTTMPLPRKYTSVLAVPRSTPISLDMSGRNLFLSCLIIYQRGYELGESPMRRGAALTQNAFKLAFGKRFLRDNHAQRYADKVAVRELFPRARVAVVPQHFDARSVQFAVQLLRLLLHFGIIAELYQMHGKRRDFVRPHQTLIIRQRLYNRTHQPRGADAVAAHKHRDTFSGFVFICKPERLRKTRPQREDVPDLYRPLFAHVFLAQTELAERCIVVHLFINRQPAPLVDEDSILAGGAHGLKLVAELAKGAAARERAVCFTPYARAVKNFQIRGGALLIKFPELFLIAGKGVEVLHDKFARAQNAGLGAQLVAELGLKLVRILGQVFVRRYMTLHQLRERLFVRSGQAHVASGFKFGFKPYVDCVVAPPAGFLPQRRLL